MSDDFLTRPIAHDLRDATWTDPVTGFEEPLVRATGVAESDETTEHRLRRLRALEAIAQLPDDMPEEQKATAIYDPVDRDAYPENEVDLSEEER